MNNIGVKIMLFNEKSGGVNRLEKKYKKKISLLEKENKLLEKQKEALKAEVVKQKTDNEILRAAVKQADVKLRDAENALTKHSEQIENLKALEKEYRNAIKEMKLIKAKYSNELGNVINDIKKNEA